MARREVTKTRKDSDGDIAALCSDGELWSPRTKAGAIQDIEEGTHIYFVCAGATAVEIHVVNGPTGKYLRTDPDQTDSNNLDDLPDC